MKALIWNYTLAMAKLDEPNGSVFFTRLFATQACQELRGALGDKPDALANAIGKYARAFSDERLAYRFGIGDKAVTNVARIKAQRELFAQLAK